MWRSWTCLLFLGVRPSLAGYDDWSHLLEIFQVLPMAGATCSMVSDIEAQWVSFPERAAEAGRFHTFGSASTRTWVSLVRGLISSRTVILPVTLVAILVIVITKGLGGCALSL